MAEHLNFLYRLELWFGSRTVIEISQRRKSLSSLLSLQMANSNAETPTQEKYSSNLSRMLISWDESALSCLLHSQYHKMTDVVSSGLFVCFSFCPSGLIWRHSRTKLCLKYSSDSQLGENLISCSTITFFTFSLSHTWTKNTKFWRFCDATKEFHQHTGLWKTNASPTTLLFLSLKQQEKEREVSLVLTSIFNWILATFPQVSMCQHI